MAEEPLRYVVLRHEGVPEPHFDVMWEAARGSPLVTIRVRDAGQAVTKMNAEFIFRR